MDAQCPLHQSGGDLVPCAEHTQRVSDQIQYQGPVFRQVCGVPTAHCTLSLVRVCQFVLSVKSGCWQWTALQQKGVFKPQSSELSQGRSTAKPRGCTRCSSCAPGLATQGQHQPGDGSVQFAIYLKTFYLCLECHMCIRRSEEKGWSNPLGFLWLQTAI